ncbi:kinase-like protein [Aspergillus indologenus CBS 114.80]|uniref:EKC/KEOPS complex subunit BUD32 n=1 Tax=Aspergillus indologenus CBS 114.80 TaxID=1450541 RepID=A0A2V5J9R9_9EURO|nr:kinase-like protein [Aspergillus indologenus CBS 114.80]
MLYHLFEPPAIPSVITYRYVHPGEELTDPMYGEVIYKAKGKFLVRGGTAILEFLPSGAVIKTPTPNPFIPCEEEDHRLNMRLEAEIYQELGEHASIPRLINWDPSTCCLTLEYLEHGNLREYVRSNPEGLTPSLRHKWAGQAAAGLRILHNAHIIHCDISPRNFLLDRDLNLKISDFAGSSLRGSLPSAYANTRYRHPKYNWDDPPHFQDDIFGLGSLIYFIMTNQYPYEEVPSDDVGAKYGSLQFPDVSGISCGTIIQQCWHQEVNAAQVCDFFERQSP